ncbi:hypothetical protein EUX98_g2983 [Antrodiella citrinella]|uniref:Uncharacterized protein n=1 Tax=Antrodiella citrinella TaxID=2447956 RepID=A0A4S4MXN6_9APHY|nr:hypothetical protein EUX98_g2983 [Antrodiella citrinella]
MAVIVPSVPLLTLAPSGTDFDFSTHGIDLNVVAAVVGASTADAPVVPEYRLVNNKRKTDDDTDNDLLAFGHVPKKPKTTEASLVAGQDVPIQEYVEPTPGQEERLNVTIEEALAAIFSLPTIQAYVQNPPAYADGPLLPPTDLQPAVPGTEPSLFPPEPAQPELFSATESTEEFVIPFRRSIPQKRQRFPSESLWQMACRFRVDTIASRWGAQAIRDNVHRVYGPYCVQEIASNPALELEICTPQDFNDASFELPSLPADEHLMNTSFDADDGSDSDEEPDMDAEGESDNEDAASPHESLLSFPAPPFSVPSMATADEYEAFFVASRVVEGPLPRLASVKAWPLGSSSAPVVPVTGTPPRTPAYACGTLQQLREEREERRLLRMEWVAQQAPESRKAW